MGWDGMGMIGLGRHNVLISVYLVFGWDGLVGRGRGRQDVLVDDGRERRPDERADPVDPVVGEVPGN